MINPQLLLIRRKIELESIGFRAAIIGQGNMGPFVLFNRQSGRDLYRVVIPSVYKMNTERPVVVQQHIESTITVFHVHPAQDGTIL